MTRELEREEEPVGDGLPPRAHERVPARRALGDARWEALVRSRWEAVSDRLLFALELARHFSIATSTGVAESSDATARGSTPTRNPRDPPFT